MTPLSFFSSLSSKLAKSRFHSPTPPSPSLRWALSRILLSLSFSLSSKLAKSRTHSSPPPSPSSRWAVSRTPPFTRESKPRPASCSFQVFKLSMQRKKFDNYWTYIFLLDYRSKKLSYLQYRTLFAALPIIQYKLADQKPLSDLIIQT
jgi:hypothetical protein